MNKMQKTLGVLLIGVASTALADDKGDVICTYAPSQSKAVSTLAGATGGAGAATAAIGNALGLSVVTHSSGAMILTGSGGYIAGTLGTAIVAPVVVTAAVAAGGTAVVVELVCAPKNHPGYVAKIEKAATDFSTHFKAMHGEMVSHSSKHIEKVATSFKDVTDDVFDYIYRY